MEFFRHCPNCGRRFHIKVVDKKLVRMERESSRREPSPRMTTFQFRGSPVLAVQEGRPILTTVEEFQYAYRCEHCGHEWSEKRVQEHRES